MLDFRPDEEQKMLTDTIGRFAKERLRKVYRDAEEEGEVPQQNCDRLRLNAQGELFNCLFSTQGLKLKNSIQQLRQHLASAEYMLQQQLQPYIWNKAAGFHAIQAQQKLFNPSHKTHSNFRKISMHMIGG